MFPRTMAGLGSHAYLRPGFRLSDAGRRMLRARYHRAIELMDAKLAAFYGGARAARLFEDTLVILTSDHGEAFGEHGLYLHDASVYNTHLHVPLWVRHPGRAPEAIDDTVSTRDLFGLIASAAGGDRCEGTILDSSYRRTHPVALAEHFYYPRCPTMDPKYRTDQAAIIVDGLKLIARHNRVTAYRLANDPGEMEPDELAGAQLDAALRHAGAPRAIAEEAKEHLFRFGDT
jgi:arylsulfatase A-like enzyme